MNFPQYYHPVNNNNTIDYLNIVNIPYIVQYTRYDSIRDNTIFCINNREYVIAKTIPSSTLFNSYDNISTNDLLHHVKRIKERFSIDLIDEEFDTLESYYPDFKGRILLINGQYLSLYKVDDLYDYSFYDWYSKKYRKYYKYNPNLDRENVDNYLKDRIIEIINPTNLITKSMASLVYMIIEKYVEPPYHKLKLQCTKSFWGNKPITDVYINDKKVATAKEWLDSITIEEFQQYIYIYDNL